MVMTPPLKPKLTPDLQAVFDAIRHMDTHKKAPPEDVAEKAGRYKHQVQAFREALTDGFDTYQSERNRFVAGDAYVSAMFATYGTPGTGQQQKDEKPQERPYQLHRFSYFKNRPRKQWLVRDMITDRGSVLICGTGGDGKSTLVLDAYLSCIFDIPFLGREKHPDIKPVFLIWVAAESQDELFPRAYAWAISHGVTEEQLEEHTLLLDMPVPLNEPGETTAFIQSANEQLAEIGVSHETHTIVAVFDTYSKCTPGADENSTKEVKIIVQMVDLVRTEMNAQVTIICHTNADGIIKGNKALRDGVDIAWIVSKNNDTICLTCDKVRGAPPLDKIYACMKSIILDENEPMVTEPVIFALDEKVGSIRFTPKEQKKILAILEKNGPMNTTKLQKECLEQHDIKRATFYIHMENLHKDGLVVKDPENAPKGVKVEYSIMDKGRELLRKSSPD